MTQPNFRKTCKTDKEEEQSDSQPPDKQNQNNLQFAKSFTIKMYIEFDFFNCAPCVQKNKQRLNITTKKSQKS